MKYIDYISMKEFYTIQETCELLEMNKQELRMKCDVYGVIPTRNEIGESGFTKYDVRKLHNKLYYEERGHKEEWNPWE